MRFLALVKWPLYAWGAVLSISACFSLWWCDDRCIYMICADGLRIDFTQNPIITDNGGLLVVLLTAGSLAAALLTTCFKRQPKGIVLACAIVLALVTLKNLVLALQPREPLTSTAAGLIYFPRNLARAFYGALVILLAAIWDCAYVKWRDKRQVVDHLQEVI